MKQTVKQNMKQKGKRQTENPAMGWLNAMCEILKGGIVALAVTLLILMAGACLISAGVLSDSAMSGLVTASCVIGALLGGLLAVRWVGSKPLPVGLGTGLILFLLLLSIGLLLYDSASLAQGGVRLALACACGGALAGVLGGRRKKPKRK